MVTIEQFQNIGKSIIDRINTTEDAIRELNLLFSASQKITELLPPATLEWRLRKWLGNGNYLMEKRYSNIVAPTLILIGAQDRLLPSRNEGRRLEDLLVNAVVDVREYPTKGHALLDGSIDLHEAIKKSKLFPVERKQLSVDVKYPSVTDIESVDNQFGWFFNGISPIFLSRGADGKLKRGIKDVPTGLETGRPVLLVGNHQVQICLPNLLLPLKSTILTVH